MLTAGPASLLSSDRVGSLVKKYLDRVIAKVAQGCPGPQTPNSGDFESSPPQNWGARGAWITYRSWSVKWLRSLLLIVLALGLSGCVDYQLGIQFDSQTHGVLTQTLHLDDRFVALNSDVRQQWLQVFIEEAKTFSGKVQSLEDGTLQVRVEFDNGADLVEKFNQLFAEDGLMTQVPGAPPLLAHLDLTQRNWGVALLNQLHADIDLTALNADSAAGNGGALDSWRTLDLSFQIDALAGSTGRWSLRPGQLNTIDTTFWVSSPIGIGAVVIGLLCLAGYGLRYGILGAASSRTGIKTQR